MTQVVFLDTEFTNFIDCELLSLDLVMLQDETRELYVELDMPTDVGKSRRASSSDVLHHEGILGQWGLVPGATATDLEMGMRAAEWLQALAAETGGPVEVVFDYGMDFELLKAVVREAGLWDRVRETVRPVNVNAVIDTLVAELAKDAAYKALRRRRLRRHHALADAHALRAAYRAGRGADS